MIVCAQVNQHEEFWLNVLKILSLQLLLIRDSVKFHCTNTCDSIKFDCANIKHKLIISGS